MHIRFANADDDFIKAEVQSGFYINETELVRDAVRRMREDKERVKNFQDAIAKGVESVESGQTVMLTPELLHEIKQEAIAKAKNNKPYSSLDAIPKDSET